MKKHMKTKMKFAVLVATISSMLASCCTAPDSPTLQHTLTVTPEIKRAFRSGDKIKIRSVTGTAPKFQIGGTYRVVGTCRQKTLNNATLYLGNTAEAGSDAIAASAGSSLYKALPNGTTKFDITFTLLRPGLLHITIYDLDNHDKNDNAYAGLYLGDVVSPR